ncbi:hypothetical protein Dimus_037776 [Dionaea muscipula]
MCRRESGAEKRRLEASSIGCANVNGKEVSQHALPDSKAGGERWVVVRRGARMQGNQEAQVIAGSGESRFQVLQSVGVECSESVRVEMADVELNCSSAEVCPVPAESKETEMIGISGDYDHRNLERERPK